MRLIYSYQNFKDMDYTSIHIYGHLLSDDILHNIERDNTLIGNRDQDFGMDISVSSAIDYVWSSLRNDWNFYKERAGNERLVNKDHTALAVPAT